MIVASNYNPTLLTPKNLQELVARGVQQVLGGLMGIGGSAGAGQGGGRINALCSEGLWESFLEGGWIAGCGSPVSMLLPSSGPTLTGELASFASSCGELHFVEKNPFKSAADGHPIKHQCDICEAETRHVCGNPVCLCHTKSTMEKRSQEMQFATIL
ncbi:hypothetical protein ACA910_003865 [Epithemia clementina (nom. ined.)]